ncbi:hypothetical protein SCAR479_00085 [Seiridium cardinale]|uniref:Uncharacterized protein n=1 Tax=Seiridium cardinale TaxID=138064 RepID=A0ABR2Y8W6_9PEZI
MEEEYCVVVATKIGITNFQFVPPQTNGISPWNGRLVEGALTSRCQESLEDKVQIDNQPKAKALGRALGRAPTQSTITSSLTGQSKIVLASDSRSLQDQKSVSGTSSAARSPTINPQADNTFVKHANSAKSSTPGIILDTRQGAMQSGAVPVTKSRSHPRTIPEVEMDANGKAWVQTKLSFNPVKPSAHSLENNKRPSETTIEPCKSSTGVLRGSPTKRRKPSTARKSWRGSRIVADSESE